MISDVEALTLVKDVRLRVLAKADHPCGENRSVSQNVTGAKTGSGIFGLFIYGFFGGGRPPPYVWRRRPQPFWGGSYTQRGYSMRGPCGCGAGSAARCLALMCLRPGAAGGGRRSLLLDK